MPVVSEMRHPSGFKFATERFIALRRDVHKGSWSEIAARVKNLRGKRPRARHVANTHRKFSSPHGRCLTKYHKCGPKPSKVSKGAAKFLVENLLQLRRDCACTSSVLQHLLAEERQVKISCSWIRKLLRENGYEWLTKKQKRQYTPHARRKRLAWAKAVLRLSVPELRKKLSLAMDGTILAMPPTDPTDRLNFCKHGEECMWRKASESCIPQLAGEDWYGKQVPATRAVPLWGWVLARWVLCGDFPSQEEARLVRMGKVCPCWQVSLCD